MRASHGRRHTYRAAAVAVAVWTWFAPGSVVSAQEWEPDELDFRIRVEPFAAAPPDEFASGLEVLPDDALIAPVAEPGPVFVTAPAESFTSPPAPVSVFPDEAEDRWLRLTDIFPLFTGDPSLAGIPVSSDEQRTRIYNLLVGYDAFRGIPDGSWENNGIHTGANYGTRLGRFSDWTGIGLQVGGTVGAYDWGGTDYRMRNKNRSQVQAFITYGLFRRAMEGSPWSAGLVQDWMLNNTWSVFGDNPTFSQLRAQVAYAISASNEFGVWGACRLINDSAQQPFFGRVRWQPHNQINLFWHHKWSRAGADTWVSIGMPEDDRLGQRGSLGDYIANALAVCPLSDRVSVYSSVMYMHQSATEGGAGSLDEAWNFTVGIALYPRANSRTTTVAGHRWAPLLPIANNGSFMVDASDTY